MPEGTPKLPPFDIEIADRRYFTETGLRQRLGKSERAWRRWRERGRTPPALRQGNSIPVVSGPNNAARASRVKPPSNSGIF